MKKVLFFLLLMTAVIGRAQTSLDLLPVGTVAPDFTVTNSKTGEKIFQLSDCKNKTSKDGQAVAGVWTVLDFWASWCPPCRKENPNVVAAYQKYKDKNFTILGVSLDNDKERWIKGIHDDHLTWTHVSDLKYWDSEVPALYAVRGIPANFLIDPEGIIIAKDLREEALQEKLEELLK